MFTFADQVDAMNEALEMERAAGKAEGRIEGKAEGKIEGMAEGENRFAVLINKLLSLGRMDDVQKATTDKKYRDILYKELGIH